jgi:hypothetical protein
MSIGSIDAYYYSILLPSLGILSTIRNCYTKNKKQIFHLFFIAAVADLGVL